MAGAVAGCLTPEGLGKRKVPGNLTGCLSPGDADFDLICSLGSGAKEIGT